MGAQGSSKRELGVKHPVSQQGESWKEGSGALSVGRERDYNYSNRF